MHKYGTEDYKRMRKLMIDAVLSTDITRHFGDVAQFKSIIGHKEFAPEKGMDKQRTVMMMFHMADISNPAKPFKLCRLWTDLLFVEFFAQGDLEKQYEMQVSMFNDRLTTNIARSQIGFIDGLVLPPFELIAQVLPNLGHMVDDLKANKDNWRSLFEEYDEKQKEGNPFEPHRLRLNNLSGPRELDFQLSENSQMHQSDFQNPPQNESIM
jgi:cAMP-specific phosphodiesterase 4